VTKQNKKQLDYDVIIVGGGMVGMAAAIVMSKLNLKTCLLENTETENNQHPSYDDRTLVVNRASQCFWKNIGIWDSLKEQLIPIDKVHVSNKGHFGTVVFEKDDLKVSALAHIIEAKVLGMALKNKIETLDTIKVICPAQMQSFNSFDQALEVKYKIKGESHTISSQLMLAADGVQSTIRSQLNLETKVKSYQRTAIICNITPEYKHNNCAYERLTKTGPTAMLPFVNNRCGFVWSVEEHSADGILELSDADFIKAAQKQFGYRLGSFMKVGRRSSYPLYLIEVPEQVKSRVILLGNAAHAMSPVSAQGLNLAVRDVAALNDVISQCLTNNDDLGSDKCLNLYQSSINKDQKQTMRYTDDLMGWFKIDESMVNTFRSAGLIAMDQLTPVKSELFTRASGYRGNNRGNTSQLLRQLS
jgi:2-octaprenyl-6-methoxyphenol hydroxylase